MDIVDYTVYKPEFDRDGFVVIRQFLPTSELQELEENLDRYIREVVPGLNDAHAFYQDRSRPETLKQMQYMGAHDPFFASYQQRPRWLSLAKALLGEPATARDPEWFNKPPGTEHVTPPHQDNYYFCLRPASVITIWLALDRVDEANGCLRYVRGSHHDGVRPHAVTKILGFSQGITDYGDADRQREVKILLEAGDAVIHHCNLIHRADANSTADRHRRAFAMVCPGQSCRLDKDANQRIAQSARDQHTGMGLKITDASD